MKYIAYMIIPLVIISLYGGCSNDNNNQQCIFELSEIANSECLAEDILELCQGLICMSDPVVSVPELFRSPCSATDCSTLACNDRSFTELAFDLDDMLFSTVIFDGENLGNVECKFFINQ